MKNFKTTASPRRTSSTYRVADEHPAETHVATCSECHARCEVPFRPNGKKPVYCRNCFKGKDATHTSFTGQPFSHSVAPSAAQSSDDLQRQLVLLHTKLDRLISAIEAQTRALSSVAK